MQLGDIATALLPAQEHVGSIRIKDTVPLALTLTAWTTSSLNPASHCPYRYPQSSGNFFLWDVEQIQDQYLLKSLLLVREPGQTMVFSIAISSLAPLLCFGELRRRKWGLGLAQFFVRVCNHWFDGLNKIFH